MKTGANDPCPCGSGYKYKRCCRTKTENPIGFWQTNAKKIINANGLDERCSKAFIALVKFISNYQLNGICHPASATLHIIFKELGMESSVCTGVVYMGEGYFAPHSWVEVDGKIFDSTCHVTARIRMMPAPIFYSKSLDTTKDTEVLFGVADMAYDEGVDFMLKHSVSEILNCEFEPMQDMIWWNVLPSICQDANIDIIDVSDDGYADASRLYEK